MVGGSDIGALIKWNLSTGAAGANDRGTTSPGTVVGAPAGSCTTTLNASGIALVQNWIKTPSSNNGFIFANYNATTGSVIFSSSEATTVSQRPKIEITYSPP